MMASPSSTSTSATPSLTELGGFPLQLFPIKFDNKFLCSYCKLILNEPVQSFCGHRFCQRCMNDITVFPEPLVCGSCEEEGSTNENSLLQKEKYFPDNALKKEMSSVPAICLNAACSWRGTFKEFTTAHRRTCEYNSVTCECGVLVPAHQLQAHKDTQCMARSITCKYCSTTMAASEHLVHSVMCKPRRDLPFQSESVNTDGVCEFGCNEVIDKDRIDEHMKTHVDKHLRVMAYRMEVLENVMKLVKLPVGDNGGANQPSLSDLMKRLRDANATSPLATGDAGAVGGSTGVGAEGKLKEVLLKVSTFEQIMSVLKGEQERCIDLVEQTKQQHNSDQRVTESLNTKLQGCERELEMRSMRINELEARLSTLESSSYDGHLVWKITEFSKRRRDAFQMICTSIYSPSFFTHRTGYRMCARLYPNGDGMGKDKYVSLFFVVMRGQYDALLPWPFRQKVTFMLLDQVGKDHIVDAFRPDPNSSSFRRPVSEMNIASGVPMFVRLEDIDKMASSYVKDDTVFVKIIVAPLET